MFQLSSSSEPCLNREDFANTVDPRQGVHPHDYLGDYADLVAWGRHAGMLTEGDARHLSDEAVR